MITERLLFVFLRAVALQISQLEIADIRTELAAEDLASLQLVDRMLAENVLGQLSHLGETDPAESAHRHRLGRLLELEDVLVDRKLVLELHNVAVLHHVVLVELLLSQERFLTEFAEDWEDLLVIIRAHVVLLFIITKRPGFLGFSLEMIFGNVDLQIRQRVEIIQAVIALDEDSVVDVQVQVVVDKLDVVNLQIRVDFLDERSAAPAINEGIVI